MPHLTNDQGPFRAEFQASGEYNWATNSMRFDTVDEAVAHARDLFLRWFGARAWRVVPDSVPLHEAVDMAQDDEDGYPNSGW